MKKLQWNFAGVGTGTDGFGIKENNYLGRGVKVDSNLNVSEEKLKGKFLVSNPNYKNLIKILIYHLRLHRLILATSGYKTKLLIWNWNKF